MDDSLIVSRRERELLEELEKLRRSKTKITIIGFCKLNNYANKSALRHFTVLKRELGLYVAECNSGGKGGSQTSSVRQLEVQINRLRRERDSKAKELEKVPKLKEEITKLREDLKQSRNIIMRLRAMVSTLVAFFSNNDLIRAQDISRQLEKLARTELDQDIPLCLEAQDAASGD